MSVAATQRAAILAVFEVVQDGVPEFRLIEIGGLYWRERLKELCAQGHPIGWEQVDGEKRYYLVSGVQRADGVGGEARQRPSSTVGSLDTPTSRLFDLPSLPHYREDEAA